LKNKSRKSTKYVFFLTFGLGGDAALPFACTPRIIYNNKRETKLEIESTNHLTMRAVRI